MKGEKDLLLVEEIGGEGKEGKVWERKGDKEREGAPYNEFLSTPIVTRIH